MVIKNRSGVSLGGASKIVTHDNGGEIIDVHIVTIDDTIPPDRNITIVQLDVEGYEKEALTGGLKVIRRCRPILILEDNHNLIESPWFAEHILSLGYEMKGIVNGNTIFSVAT